MITQQAILVIYTGGTIGMILDEKTGTLYPFDIENIYKQIPVLERFDCTIDCFSFSPLMDSANAKPEFWIELAEVIEKNYEKYDGFVVLSGTDTMSYSASALSFMLENLNKPVIFTGSQLPIGMIRTDGRENFITSILIASAKEDETPVVPEVCIYFENKLYRGNRTHKSNAENFKAFLSGNYPLLAEAGVNIKYNHHVILKPNFKKLKVHKVLNTNVASLKLYPGISKEFIESVLNTPNLAALVLETYGAGNAPTEPWFIDSLKKAIDNNIIIVNISQCKIGSVDMGKYETGKELSKIGVISGYDITFESAITKLMFLLGNGYEKSQIKQFLNQSLHGEITIE